jgi:Holliday junction resolvase
MNSCRKGADGERELARLLHEHGFQTERGGTCSYGTAPDLSGLPGIHIECKRVERLNIHKAMDQAKADSKKFRDGAPTVFHRIDRGSWLVTMNFDDWIKLYKNQTNERN